VAHDHRDVTEVVEARPEFVLQINVAFLEKFRDLGSRDGPELIALMHEFERSKEKADEWGLYAAIGEMIEAANDVEVPETNQELENAVRDSEEFRALIETGQAAREAIGGDHA